MEALITCLIYLLMPVFLIVFLLWMTARLFLPSQVIGTAAGMLLRDFFWIGVKLIGMLISLPFQFLSSLFAGKPSRRHHRRRRCRRDRRHW